VENSEINYNLTSINPIDEYAEVRQSKIHGLGLFAKRFIPKGTVWWHARPQDVLLVSKWQFIILENSEKTYLIEDYIECLLTYSYYDEMLNLLIFCLDNSRYVNHSVDPNSGTNEEHELNAITIRDIPPGEEITEDYTYYAQCDWLKNYREYFDPTCW
jgi:SET domain-containing protein